MKKEFAMSLTRIFFIVLLGCVFISVNHSKAKDKDKDKDKEVYNSIGQYQGKIDPANKVLGLSLLK